jgi:hypothetical protein
MRPRTTTLLLAITAGAALVGVVRQRREQQSVARGVLEPATAAADVAARVAYGPLAARLAAWVPPVPATGPGRLAAAIWAAPLTAVGFTLALLAGRVPRWDPERHCFVTTDVGGLSRITLRALGMDANAIGHVVLCTRPTASDTLLAHEAVHTRQAERFGPLLPVVYAWCAARYGYRDHPLERAARLGARHALSFDQSSSDRDVASG